MVNVRCKRCAHQGAAPRRHHTAWPDAARTPSSASSTPRREWWTFSKRCVHEGCTTQASLGVYDGRKKADFFSKHAKSRMANVTSPRCANQGWLYQDPVNGHRRWQEGGLIMLPPHAKPGMVSVVGPRRVHVGCTKHPSYGVDGSKKRRHSSQHARTEW